MKAKPKTARFSILEWFVARRLVGSRKKSYVSLVSSVSTWGLALGVASLVVIFSVTSGFEDVFREKILGVYPHLVVIGKGGELADWADVVDKLNGRPHLTSSTPATYDEMMASHRGRRGGCIVKGIDTTDPGVVKTIEPFLDTGTLADLQVEPAIVFEGGNLSISRVPGGSSYTIVVLPDGSLTVATSYEEEESVPRCRLLAATRNTLTAEIAGILLNYEAVVEPGTTSRFFDVPEGEVELVVDGNNISVSPGAGNHTLVVSQEGGEYSLHDCPSPQPTGSSSPAQLCIVNLQETSLTTIAPSGRKSVGPKTARVLEETNVEKPTVILGKELADKIEARPGDEIRLVSPLFSVPGVASARKRGRTIADTFVVKGIISLGFYEYDSKLTVIDFNAARRFLHQGDVARWVEVRVDDLFESESRGIEVGRFLSDFSLLDVQEFFPVLVDKYSTAARGLDQSSDPAQFLANTNQMLGIVKFSDVRGELSFGFEDQYRIISWEEMNKPLFTSMKRQRLVLSLFFLIIIVVAAFNIVSSQMMIVKEKTSDIAILKAMGTTNGQVKRIFLLQGMTVGLIGTGVGLLVAVALCLFLDKIGFPLDPKVYFVSKLPVNLRLGDVGVATALSLVSIYVAVSVAARRAADKSPVEGLRELE